MQLGNIYGGVQHCTGFGHGRTKFAIGTADIKPRFAGRASCDCIYDIFVDTIHEGMLPDSCSVPLSYIVQDDPVASINGMLQSLRLWNRAFDTLSRLTPSPPSKSVEADSDNPFLQESEPRQAPSRGNEETRGVEQLLKQTPSLSGIGWRISEGLLNTLFSLTRAYVSRGSPREAEFFARQAQDLAVALNMPAMISRALCRLGEIYLHLGQLNDSHACLAEAAKLISDASGPDAAEIRRLHADHSRVSASKGDARQLYDEAISLLEELEQQFTKIDGHAVRYALWLFRVSSADKTQPEEIRCSVSKVDADVFL